AELVQRASPLALLERHPAEQMMNSGTDAHRELAVEQPGGEAPGAVELTRSEERLGLRELRRRRRIGLGPPGFPQRLEVLEREQEEEDQGDRSPVPAAVQEVSDRRADQH